MKRFMLVVTVALLTGACAPSVQVESWVAPEAVPPEPGLTYTWRATSGGVDGDPRTARNSALDAAIREIVDGELAARGFTRVDGDADMGVAYVAAVERELDVDEVNDLFRYRRAVVVETWTSIREYDRGSLVLDFTTAEGDLRWRGVASAELNREDREYREQKLREAVRAILDELPEE